MSKRDLTQNTTLDLLIVLLLSDVVQNALIGDDNSILGALVGAGALLLSAVLNRVSAKNIQARRLLEGEPILLVHNGCTLDDNMARYAVSRAGLNAGLRGQNRITLAGVRYTFPDLDGTISVTRKSEQTGSPDCMPPELAVQYQG